MYPKKLFSSQDHYDRFLQTVSVAQLEKWAATKKKEQKNVEAVPPQYLVDRLKAACEELEKGVTFTKDIPEYAIKVRVCARMDCGELYCHIEDMKPVAGASVAEKNLIKWIRDDEGLGYLADRLEEILCATPEAKDLSQRIDAFNADMEEAEKEYPGHDWWCL